MGKWILILSLLLMTGCGSGGGGTSDPVYKTSAIDGTWKHIPTESNNALYDFHLLTDVTFVNGKIYSSDSTTTAGSSTISDIINNTQTRTREGTFTVSGNSVTFTIDSYNGVPSTTKDTVTANFSVVADRLVLTNNNTNPPAVLTYDKQ